MVFESSKLERSDLVYPELSYEMIGCAYEVFNELKAGQPEKVYQRAMAVMFKNKNLSFEEQVYHNITFKGEVIYKGFLDFKVENKVIVELKKDDHYSKNHIDQVVQYLRTSERKLALLINFGTNGVKFKRIVNIKD